MLDLLWYLEPVILCGVFLHGMKTGWLKENDVGETQIWTHHAMLIWLVLIPFAPLQWLVRFIFIDDFHQHFTLRWGKAPVESLVGRIGLWVLALCSVIALIIFGMGYAFGKDSSYPWFVLSVVSLVYLLVESLLSDYMDEHGESFLHRSGGQLGLYEWKFEMGLKLRGSRFSWLRKLGNFLEGP